MTVLLAPAKLTWFLEITGVRRNGFHELHSEMLTLALSDELAIDPTGNQLVIPNNPTLPTDATNLVNRALALVGRTAGVTLTKRIPLGGGLGGGSADAGAILRWAGGVSDELALTLGGDVPFCQLGGRALVEGVGERLTALPFIERPVTLFLPTFSVATAAVYQAYDQLFNSGERPRGRNHLEEAARMVEPRLAMTLDWLRANVADVVVAGSGSTMFAEGHVACPTDVAGPCGVINVVQTTTTPAATN